MVSFSATHHAADPVVVPPHRADGVVMVILVLGVEELGGEIDAVVDVVVTVVWKPFIGSFVQRLHFARVIAAVLLLFIRLVYTKIVFTK